MSHPLFNKILSDSGYKSADGRPLTYVDYWRQAPKELVDYYKSEYNINTDCHSACVNCQISQLNKYPDELEWAVKTPVADLVDIGDKSKIVLKLKKFQQVKVVSKNDDMWQVNVTRYMASCVNDSSHKKLASMNRSSFANSLCKECGSDMYISSNPITGLVHKSNLTGFLIQCSFIPKNYDLPEELSNLPQHEKDLATSAIDPSAWSRKFLSRTLRPHQEVVNRCTAKFKVLRQGRRTGKSYGQAINLLNFVFNTQFQEGTGLDGQPIYRGAVVLILTPFLSQISILWGAFEELLGRNEELKSMVKRNVKTPFHQLEFTNGAIIKAFTTGAQSKQEASTVRGASSDFIFIDEADYIPTDDIRKAVEPIMITYPHVKLVGSSTPKGRREWFYKVSKETPFYKEFYFPSTVLDNWDEIKSTIDTNHDAFMQEYIADFIAEDVGMYQPHFVAQAELTYEYCQGVPFDFFGQQIQLNKPLPTWTYSIGVDWNSNAGTEVVVVGMSPQGHCFVVEAVNVPKQDWQMLKSENVIFDLHRKWNPQYVYVDAGYGVGQIEHMQVSSAHAASKDPNHPDSRIGPKITAYDFSKKIEYRHPLTGEVKSAIAKPFLVENSVRHFENGLIFYPASDSTLHNQLLNYIKAGVSNLGLPRYGMHDDKVGDHRVDALNLALVAFKLEMTDFAMNTPAVTGIAFARGFGGSHTVSTINDGGKILTEIKQNIPLNEHGQPAVGLATWNVRHDPEYLKMKEAEKYLEASGKDKSRSRAMENTRLTKDKDQIQEFRPGFDTDTEWQYKLDIIKRRASASVHKRSNTKPRRKTV